MGYAAGEVTSFDQRDTVFSRNRTLQPGTENYRQYYEMHPEREAHDAKRRAVGGLLGKMGAIDKQYRPNVEMIQISPQMGGALAPHAGGFRLPEDEKTRLTFEPNSTPTPDSIGPEKASDIIKGYAKLLGADVVGICKVNPLWAYTHKEVQEWGDETLATGPKAVFPSGQHDLRNQVACPKAAGMGSTSR